MTDPTMNTTNMGTTQRPPAYGGKAIPKGKQLRKLTSKTRKVSVKQ